ncbi:MAG: hypothetical protein KDA78_18190, partial [Planctomycetaceae bacterium]|nr:hypothetical protein [Planctomycetaceae bacterium]
MSSKTLAEKPGRFRWETARTVVETSIRNNPVMWVLGSLLLLRMGFIALSPVDLIADESYYWDWSRRLDYGYYSKPPMIAWINWLSTAVLGA